MDHKQIGSGIAPPLGFGPSAAARSLAPPHLVEQLPAPPLPRRPCANPAPEGPSDSASVRTLLKARLEVFLSCQHPGDPERARGARRLLAVA
jgi:hypothetical protein